MVSSLLELRNAGRCIVNLAVRLCLAGLAWLLLNRVGNDIGGGSFKSTLKELTSVIEQCAG